MKSKELLANRYVEKAMDKATLKPEFPSLQEAYVAGFEEARKQVLLEVGNWVYEDIDSEYLKTVLADLGETEINF